MSVLVDTNVLLRSIEPPHPQHAEAVGAVTQLLAEGAPVYFTLQSIAEFWNVAARPIENNGLGLSITSALGEVEKIEGLLTFLPTTLRFMLSGNRSLLNTAFRARRCTMPGSSPR